MSLSKIPWSVPGVGAEELAEVNQSFDADWLTQGPKVREFENAMADRLGVPHAIAVSNGSIAIDIALNICGIRPGDEVIVPAITYFATAAAVSRVGAVPVFVDIDLATGNLDPARLADAVSDKTRAALFIDYGGGPARVDELRAECERLGLRLIQDAAQSLGATWRGKPMGAETEISTMSFHMAKIIATVEGGMIFTHNADFAAEARIYRNQGETAKYMHGRLGYNARMTDMAAGIGLAQFRKLDHYLAERERVANRYDERLAGHNTITTMPCTIADARHANFLYSIQVDDRDRVQATLAAGGIDARTCYPLPLQHQAIYASGQAPSRAMNCPASTEFAAKILNPPIFPTMTNDMVDRVADAILDCIR